MSYIIKPLTAEEIEIARHNMTRYWYGRLFAHIEARDAEIKEIACQFVEDPTTTLGEQVRSVIENWTNWSSYSVKQDRVIEAFQQENATLKAKIENTKEHIIESLHNTNADCRCGNFELLTIQNIVENL